MIERTDNNPTPEVAEDITLDSPRFLPADARHISRLLKAAGLTRAERVKGTSGNYTYGFNVQGNDLSVYRVSDHNRDEAIALIQQATEILRDKGYVVAGHGNSGSLYRSIYKPVTTQDDDSMFWYNLNSVYVGHGDILVPATRCPAFVIEKKAIARRAKERAAENKRQQEADLAQAQALRAALEAAGLPCSVNGTWIHVHAKQLEGWLVSKGVSL
jgi:hypothetical protein